MVSAIGAAEALNFGAPKKIDGEGGINLVKAAQAAGVQHFVMVSSLGTGKFGWPAGKHRCSCTITASLGVTTVWTSRDVRVRKTCVCVARIIADVPTAIGFTATGRFVKLYLLYHHRYYRC